MTAAGAWSAAQTPPARGCSTLILVHRQPLLEQWRTQLSLFLDLDSNKIGKIGGGKRKVTSNIDVAMIQSLTRKGMVEDIVENYGQIIGMSVIIYQLYPSNAFYLRCELVTLSD